MRLFPFASVKQKVSWSRSNTFFPLEVHSAMKTTLRPKLRMRFFAVSNGPKPEYFGAQSQRKPSTPVMRNHSTSREENHSLSSLFSQLKNQPAYGAKYSPNHSGFSVSSLLPPSCFVAPQFTPSKKTRIFRLCASSTKLRSTCHCFTGFFSPVSSGLRVWIPKFP